MSAFPPLTSLTIEPKSKHTATIVFLHGFGDSGHGWEPVATMYSRDPTLDHIKWILPHAPTRPVTINNNLPIPAWFDILERGSEKEDMPGIHAAATAIAELLAAEDARTPGRVVLGGFSQGAALALITGLTRAPAPAGVLVLSGRAMLRAELAQAPRARVDATPVFWAHGTEDAMIALERVREGVEFVKGEVGMRDARAVGEPGLDFRVYEGMRHSTCEDELSVVREFLRMVVPREQLDGSS